MRLFVPFLLIYSLLSSHFVMAEPAMSADELDAWFNDDSETRALAVNEGRLVFLVPPADRSGLYTDNVLMISEQSLNSGWVKLKQCHHNLDAVNKVDIVYTYIQMKNLRIDSRQGIGEAKVAGQSVQLENVTRHASLCIKADVRVFYRNEDGSFSLRNGPYYRKFLDGYYPYNVTMEINYPGQLLSFIESQPKSQQGFEVKQLANQIRINAWFDGALRTEMRFKRVD